MVTAVNEQIKTGERRRDDGNGAITVKQTRGAEKVTTTTWANKMTTHESDSEDGARTKDVPACEIRWVTGKNTREPHAGQEQRRLWTPAIDLVLKERRDNNGDNETGWIRRCEHEEEQDNLIAVNGRQTRNGARAKWHYTDEEINAANSELGYDGMKRDTKVQAHQFDTSYKTGTPDDAATIMMDVQHLRNEQVSTEQAAERMWDTRFSHNNTSSMLKWTKAHYDGTNQNYTGLKVHTRNARDGIVRLRHYPLRNARQTPIESQQHAWRVLDRIESRINEEPDTARTRTAPTTETEAPMNTGPDRTTLPKFPKEPRWEDPAIDLDRWRREFLGSLGVRKTEALREHIEQRSPGQAGARVTFHLGVDGSYYERPCKEETTTGRQDQAEDHGEDCTGSYYELTMATPAEPPGAGTAAISMREEQDDDMKRTEPDATRNVVGKGEIGFHVPGPVASSTYTETYAAIVLTLIAPLQMSQHGVVSATQDNDGSRVIVSTATRTMTTRESMTKTNRPASVLARCAQRWRMKHGGEPMVLEHVKGHADKKPETDLTPQEKVNVRADHTCYMTYDNHNTIEEGDNAMTTEQRDEAIASEGTAGCAATHYRHNVVMPRATRRHGAVEEPTMAMYMPIGTTECGTGTTKSEHYVVAPPKSALTTQRKLHWQRELQKQRVHGALSTHPCDEILLRQRKNFRATPQVKRMTQKAKTQTVPVLSERMRLNPNTPGCPDNDRTAEGHGPEDGCMFCDHRSGWSDAMDRAKLDEETAKEDAKRRCTQRQDQNNKKRQRKAGQESNTDEERRRQQQQPTHADEEREGRTSEEGEGDTHNEKDREHVTEDNQAGPNTTTRTTTARDGTEPEAADNDAGIDWSAAEKAATAAEERQYPRDTFAHMLRCPHSSPAVQMAMSEIVKGVNERINAAAKRTAKEDKEWDQEHTADEYQWTTQDLTWLDTTKTSEERMRAWAAPYTGEPVVKVWPTGRNGELRPDEMLRQSNKVATWASFPPKGLREKLKASLLSPDEIQATWNRTTQPAIANALHEMVHERIDIEETWAIDRARHPEHISQSYRKREWPDETPVLQRAWNRACKDLEATMVIAAAHRHMDWTGETHDLSGTIEIDNIQKRALRDDMRTLLENSDRWEQLETRRRATQDNGRKTNDANDNDDGNAHDDDEDSGMW